MSEQLERFLRDPFGLTIPWVESPFFHTILEGMDVDEQYKQYARDYNEKGFLVLEDFFEPELVEELGRESERLFEAGKKFNVPPEFEGPINRDPGRKQDAWILSDAVAQLAAHPKIIDLLEFLYAREPFPFQTLNFRVGTQQPAHADSIHFSTIPAGFMAGVWVALEDIDESMGPLCYYPGSHKLPEIQLGTMCLAAEDNQEELGVNYLVYEDYVRAIAEAQGLEKQTLTVKKGTALIWSAKLLHGGTPVTREGATRMSQVTHYYFNGCVYYTPGLSNAYAGELRVREVKDIRTGKVVEHKLGDKPARLEKLPNGNSRLLHGVGNGGAVWKRLRRKVKL